MPERSNTVPEGCTTVVPWVVTDATGAFLGFGTEAFGGEELGRVPTGDGLIGHGEIRVGDTVVPAFDRHDDWPAVPSPLRVFVADADEALSRAVAAGGRVVAPVTDDAFGQRGGRVKDPFGNIWWVVDCVEYVSEEERGKRLRDPLHAEDVRVAREALDVELGGRRHGRSSAPVKATG
ncbi:VOC family protein [Streptomyces sp. NEAU-W12]|uniref:VOC family protein n=1 Tax=Streptomyces sp. NEAU-W12 TaxID=2994668 RepID=UPI00224B1B53|nr:VOC family protein [Streptomyces sp. NEAU-W12]MCX2922515.1 VOC family protein [Streptomyces sp. NEAU-W12]